MNRYEREGLARGRRDAQSGLSLNDVPRQEELGTGTLVEHTERYQAAWTQGWSEEMGFAPDEFQGEW